MPIEFHFPDYSHFLCVGEKFIVIGLEYENEPTSSIMVFDFMSHTWRNGAEIHVHEFEHQIAYCASPKGLVYITGECQHKLITLQGMSTPTKKTPKTCANIPPTVDINYFH